MAAGVTALMPAGIVVLGSVNVDYVFAAERLPAPGETLTGTTFATEFGGKGANQAVAAARLDGNVRFLGCVGLDSAGDAALTALATDGIDTRGARRAEGQPTGCAGIFVGRDAGNAIVVVAGANGAVDERSVADWQAVIASADCLLLQLETPMAAVVAAAHVARAGGATVIVDPAPAPGPLPPQLIGAVDILTPNETEAAVLLGRSLPADAAARALADTLDCTVLLTLGANGCMLARPHGKHASFAAVPAQARNTVAAGDTFNGALAVALAEGRPLEDAIDFAQRAAAIAVTRDGAQRSMPMRSEVDAAGAGVGEQ